jgi:hypothetical protein
MTHYNILFNKSNWKYARIEKTSVQFRKYSPPTVTFCYFVFNLAIYTNKNVVKTPHPL